MVTKLSNEVDFVGVGDNWGCGEDGDRGVDWMARPSHNAVMDAPLCVCVCCVFSLSQVNDAEK